MLFSRSSLVCPHCGSDQLRLSRRRPKGWRPLVAKAWRCRHCNRRFWRPSPLRIAVVVVVGVSLLIGLGMLIGSLSGSLGPRRR